MTSRQQKKIQKHCDSLRKCSLVKAKDVEKLIDLVGSDYIESYSPEYFDLFREKRIEGSNNDIVKLLLDTISRAQSFPQRASVALEIVKNLMVDAPTKEKFLLARFASLVTDTLSATVLSSRITEIVAIHLLRILSSLKAEFSDSVGSPNVDPDTTLRVLLTFAQSAETENEVLMTEIGTALMPFYKMGMNDGSDAWKGNPVRFLLMAAQSKQAAIHREIPTSEVALEAEIFSSPLCKVYRGRWKDMPCAIKQFSVMGLGFTWEEFYKEVGLMCIAQHPNVVRICGAYTANGNTEEPFIVTELCQRGNLHEAVVAQYELNPEGFEYYRMLTMCLDIAKSLAYLHSLGIIHRDVKTTNFLVGEDFTVKMIDFGVSRVLTTSLMTTVGTPTFMAPEVLGGKTVYTELADVYSFGLVIYELLSGAEPYADVPALSLAMEVLKGVRPTLRPEVVNRANPDFIVMMKQCWSKEESDRPGFKEIMVTLLRLRNAPPPSGAQKPTEAEAAKMQVSAEAIANAHDKSLLAYEWYHGKLPKDKAVKLLSGKGVGTFLVRDSSRPGCFAASVVFADGIRHILVQPGTNGRYVVDALDNKNYNFRSIPAVVRSYSNLLVSSLGRSA